MAAVNSAYYTLMLALASKDVLQQNYDNAKFNAEMYEKKFKVGTASEYDVLHFPCEMVVDSSLTLGIQNVQVQAHII